MTNSPSIITTSSRSREGGLMPVRPCLACGALTRKGSYCPRHKGTGARGSTWRWRKTRAAVITRDGGCVVCGALAPLEVHHVVMKRDGGSDHPSNLRAYCHAHHPRGT